MSDAMTIRRRVRELAQSYINRLGDGYLVLANDIEDLAQKVVDDVIAEADDETGWNCGMIPGIRRIRDDY